MTLQDPHADALTPGVAVLGDRAYEEVIQVKQGH